MFRKIFWRLASLFNLFFQIRFPKKALGWFVINDEINDHESKETC